MEHSQFAIERLVSSCLYLYSDRTQWAYPSTPVLRLDGFLSGLRGQVEGDLRGLWQSDKKPSKRLDCAYLSLSLRAVFSL
ncbi:MAG: hypothetical protein HLUCCA11_02235 [Phormidesmis priestleyi Ana]|uniref:Uncharacterized protein n=1 Tax=Phormidesmis priestleyi Ana TaxID=1666911 RepID=A0A0P8A2S1_9CYAN|nr:MAG: hypothetical protein HLUCCA11_02235 [Phormidesmis priestleyi Ana]